MHIAHFTNTYYPVISGVVRSVSTFRQGLTELGHTVFIFAQHSSGHEDSEPFVFRYPVIDTPFTRNFPVTIPISRFIDRLLPSLKLEVIHSHHPFLLGQAAAVKAQELDLPLVFTFHTRYREYSHYVSLNQHLVKDAIDLWVGEYMQRCHHVVVPSDSIKRMLADLYGVTGQVTTIPTGINLGPYQTADPQRIRQERGWGQDKVLISIGRLAKEKNWKTLLAAVAEVSQDHRDVRLVIIGDGDEKRALKKFTQELEIADRVEFTGKIPFEEVPHYLKAADLFCFSSITETQGLVTMEALAADLPVVAVEASGTSDVVEHDQQGLLTENDSHAMAQAIQKVLEDEALRHRLKEAAQERAKDFDMLLQAERLVDVYHRAIEDQKAGRVVRVDKQKKIFKLMIDEEQWQKWLGLEKEA